MLGLEFVEYQSMKFCSPGVWDELASLLRQQLYHKKDMAAVIKMN